MPATVAAALGSVSHEARQLGSINLPMWACIAPAQAAAVWVGAQVAQRIPAENLSRVFAVALIATAVVMLCASL
jgi:uncharacterized membrane protein YfcA